MSSGSICGKTAVKPEGFDKKLNEVSEIAKKENKKVTHMWGKVLQKNVTKTHCQWFK